MVAIVMGVTGAGKTTVGELLAKELGWEFVDGDRFHSTANVEKIRNGIPLNDADREPWLHAMREAITGWIADQKNVVLACSALKRVYRDQLSVGDDVKFVYLKGSYELISSRLKARHGHFASESILASQFTTLEEPQDATVVEADQLPERMVAEIRQRLALI